MRKCLKKWIGSAMLWDMTVQTSIPYTDPERHSGQCHRQTDRHHHAKSVQYDRLNWNKFDFDAWLKLFLSLTKYPTQTYMKLWIGCDCCTHLDSGLSEVDSKSQLLAAEYVRIVGFLKHAFQLIQLETGECCTIATLLALWRLMLDITFASSIHPYIHTHSNTNVSL